VIAQKSLRLFIATVSIGVLFISTSTWANEKLPEPKKLQVASGLSKKEAVNLLNTAQQYYAFWNTGIEYFAIKALASNFIDLNLPKGRPQGHKGPLIGAARFRQAVPEHVPI
jgi:hypothetical protein